MFLRLAKEKGAFVTCLVFSALLTACVADTENQSSSEPDTGSGGTSSSASSSSLASSADSSSSESSGLSQGDAVSGAELWKTKCQICHGVDGLVTEAGDPVPPQWKMNILEYPLDSALVSKIEQMVPGNPNPICTGQCALDVAAHVRTFELPIALSCEAGDLTYGRRSLHILTKEEYKNSVEDLLGLTDDIDTDLPDDSVYTQFASHIDRFLDDSSATQYFNLAQKIAELAVARSLPFQCSNNCADRFIDEFAMRAYRRPLNDDEKAVIRKLFNDYPESGIETALTAVLTSPNFLYRSAMGVSLDEAVQANLIDNQTRNQLPSDTYVLTSYELAAELSYMYTGSTPSADMMQRAAQGRLRTENDIDAAVESLISSPRGKEHFGRFAGIWLRTDEVTGVGKDINKYPSFTQTLKSSMAEEVRAVFREVMYSEDLGYDDFWGGSFTMLNSELANYYGIGGVNGNDFTRVENPTNRGGILTTGAFMVANSNAEESSPIKRGARVRELIMCQHFGPIPPLADEREELLKRASDDRLAGRMNTRDYYEIITDSPACASCHESGINPMFGMEDFDHLGLFREMETTPAGTELPITTDGKLLGLDSFGDGRELAFDGAKDFSAKLATINRPKFCMAFKGFRYLMKRGAESEDIDDVAGELALSTDEESSYHCATDRMVGALSESNGDIKAMFKSLGKQTLVRYRKAVREQ